MCKEQNIFVDFSQLPAQISALLDFCVLNRAGEQQIDRFLCVMKQQNTEESQTSALLDILEHNDFRNLLHLRLRFERATAEAASQWLARKLLMQRRANQELQAENEEVREQREVDRQKISQIKQSLMGLK